MSTNRLFQISSKMYHEGLSDESFIMEALINSIGGTCSKSSKTEDIKEHIDFWWLTPKGINIGIDAKGLHRNKRGDATYSDNHWIEVKNVKGENGWIYGKADYIGFRTINNILFVKPQKLINLYEKYVKYKHIEYIIPRDYYIPYQRNNRKDVIFKVPNSFLKEISSFVINTEVQIA